MMEEQEYKSKSQVKRELHVLQDLGRELIGIPEKLLDKVPLDDELRGAILDAKRFKREALRRQIQYIGGLMRHADMDSIKSCLIELKKPHKEAADIFHEVEAWRDSLLGGDMEILSKLAERYPEFDRQYVKQLLRNAKKEGKQNKAPKSSRALFRYLNMLSGQKNT